MSIAVMKQALEALEGVLDDSPKVLDASISGGLYEVVQCRDAIAAIRTAIEQAEKRQWIELTDDEARALVNRATFGDRTNWQALVYMVDAKLKERNA
jgi:hypothetical protein